MPDPVRPPVAHLRVSTDRQGRGGFGLEARRAAVQAFAAAVGFTIAGEHIEVETGKGSDALERRPELAAALAAARRLECAVVVAKLDRLSRDVVAFIKEFVPGGRKGKQGPRTDNRRFLDALLWMARSGGRWCDLPERLGDHRSVKRRYDRWIEMGVLDTMLSVLAREADLA